MRIFSRGTLIEFWRKHPEAEGALRLWFSIVERASWTGPADVKDVFGNADFLQGNRIVFDLRGNTYRLIAQVKYSPLFLVYIRFIGTHADDDDRIDASTV